MAPLPGFSPATTAAPIRTSTGAILADLGAAVLKVEPLTGDPLRGLSRPAKIEGRDWTSAEKDEFARTVIDQIGNYSPDFKDLIVHYEVRTPRTIEDEIGITEGNIFHGELTMDQLLFNRPIPGYAQYRGPVAGLYMCGSSAHPGGGVMAAPGANAAREILADLKRPNTVPENFGDD